MNKIQFAIIGAGTVGGEVIRQFLEQKGKAPFNDFQLKYVCEKYPKKEYDFSFPYDILRDDASIAVNDPEIKFIIELIGGITPAKEIIAGALRAGKHVITANKALLAECGEELFTQANKARKMIRYEASVGGGIPVIRAVTENLRADEILSFEGVLNATTNYVITRMKNFQEKVNDSLAHAQKLGLAEKDASKDISGADAAHKLAVLITTIENVLPPFKHIKYKGISDLSPVDFQIAEKLGFMVKLVVRYKKGRLMRVEPLMIARENPLAVIDYELNAVNFKCKNLGYIFMSGAGGGGRPTAVSVLSDMLQIKKDMELNNYIPELKTFAPPEEEFLNNFCVYAKRTDGLDFDNIPVAVKLKGVFKIEEKDYKVVITEKITDEEIDGWLKENKNIRALAIELGG